jgi:hypothetical protein
MAVKRFIRQTPPKCDKVWKKLFDVRVQKTKKILIENIQNKIWLYPKFLPRYVSICIGATTITLTKFSIFRLRVKKLSITIDKTRHSA